MLVGVLTGCGEGPSTGPESAGDRVVCSSTFQPSQLVVRVTSPVSIGTNTTTPPPMDEASTSDPAVIKNVAAVACALPQPPADIICTADLGPSFELHFTARNEATAIVRVQTFGCEYVSGLGPQRYRPDPLWRALAEADLPFGR